MFVILFLPLPGRGMVGCFLRRAQRAPAGRQETNSEDNVVHWSCWKFGCERDRRELWPNPHKSCDRTPEGSLALCYLSTVKGCICCTLSTFLPIYLNKSQLFDVCYEQQLATAHGFSFSSGFGQSSLRSRSRLTSYNSNGWPFIFWVRLPAGLACEKLFELTPTIRCNLIIGNLFFCFATNIEDNCVLVAIERKIFENRRN